ncbi:hypothetical protein SAMN04487848_0214 [Microbacterium sp. ru370.1]|uniref:hypothetical protein n=1 Tax=unclassified Microbacterium TaxID=2609290 RepID=UPI000887F97A|nr:MULTISPECIES: hypothetical protein [unclassified Microbacterium]SDO28937.1 hypothetical protein SAMN04487848_0214 [Microbacterium sp. ru370.1]SIT75389.1 hypothetical protein SAMN05880579_0210 [Microbacterium sp. RU1D]
MELAVGLLAVSAAVATVVLLVALPRIGMPGRTTLFLRFAAVAGVSAVGSSSMYFIYTAGGGILSLVLGDVAMVLAPSLLLVAVSVLEGRAALRTSLAVVALALIVAVVTATVPLPGSLVVKALALALACAACAVVAFRADIDPFAPVRLIALTTAVFALYCVARVIVGVTAGWTSALYLVGFSYAPATVLGGVAVVLVGAAAVRLRFGRREPVEEIVCPNGAAVVVGDWDLAVAAYGSDRVHELVAQLRQAARDLDPRALDVPRGAELTTPDPLEAMGARLRAEYGWEAEDVILLVDGSSTAAIRTQTGPVRRQRWWHLGRS